MTKICRNITTESDGPKSLVFWNLYLSPQCHSDWECNLSPQFPQLKDWEGELSHFCD